MNNQLFEFGMYEMTTGQHREASCATQAVDMWQNAPRSEGEWALVLDWTIATIETTKE